MRRCNRRPRRVAASACVDGVRSGSGSRSRRPMTESRIPSATQRPVSCPEVFTKESEQPAHLTLGPRPVVRREGVERQRADTRRQARPLRVAAPRPHPPGGLRGGEARAVWPSGRCRRGSRRRWSPGGAGISGIACPLDEGFHVIEVIRSAPDDRRRSVGNRCAAPGRRNPSGSPGSPRLRVSARGRSGCRRWCRPALSVRRTTSTRHLPVR